MNIFITGGTTGIGLSLAKEYLKKGHRVGICGRNRDKFLEQFPSPPSQLVFYEVDVVEREKLLAVMDRFAMGGGLDMVVANAGISMANKKKIPDFGRARMILETNVLGVLHTFEGALKIMMTKPGPERGHLVAVASVAGLVGLPGTGAYCASKAAVLKLCETFSIDLKAEGIHVTAIAPGFIDTPLTQNNRHPMPFLMSAERAAELMVQAIAAKKDLYIFPFRMKLLISLLYFLPRPLYIKLMRGGGDFYLKLKNLFSKSKREKTS